MQGSTGTSRFLQSAPRCNTRPLRDCTDTRSRSLPPRNRPEYEEEGDVIGRFQVFMKIDAAQSAGRALGLFAQPGSTWQRVGIPWPLRDPAQGDFCRG